MELKGDWEVCRNDEQAPGEVAVPMKDMPKNPVWKAIAVPSDKDAWAKLPKPVSGGDGKLPNWAKAFVPHLPRTAAAMLELDLAHRTKSPLDPALRAKMRWVVATAKA